MRSDPQLAAYVLHSAEVMGFSTAIVSQAFALNILPFTVKALSA
jgi:hypothetical protein